jgi:hypothetical protein
MIKNRLRNLTAIGALVDTAQTHAAKIAGDQHPDSLTAAAAVALQHALECAQVQAITLRRLLSAPPQGREQERNKEETTPCPPDSPAAA